MASCQDLSTPKCPAEIRAWLLIYQKRIGTGKTLIEAFIKQFPDRDHSHIQYHAAVVRDSNPALQSQLLDLAKGCSWYEDAPREGEKGYNYMKNLERQEAARERLRSKDVLAVEDCEEPKLGEEHEGKDT